jgi:hypothetical protein
MEVCVDRANQRVESEYWKEGGGVSNRCLFKGELQDSLGSAVEYHVQQPRQSALRIKLNPCTLSIHMKYVAAVLTWPWPLLSASSLLSQYEDVWGSCVNPPRILNLSSTVVSFILRQLNPGETTDGAHWIWYWEAHRACHKTGQKTKTLFLQRLKPLFLLRPAPILVSVLTYLSDSEYLQRVEHSLYIGTTCTGLHDQVEAAGATSRQKMMPECQRGGRCWSPERSWTRWRGEKPHLMREYNLEHGSLCCKAL